jgi:predicted nucleic acid-binding protein
MPPIDVVSDASVVLKWFHAEGEEQVQESRELLSLFRERRIGLYVLDLTMYEVANALLRGRVAAADAVSVVLAALGEMVPRWVPRPVEWSRAAAVAEMHRLTVYDATYAAVAERRDALLVTMHAGLLAARLGLSPSDALQRIPEATRDA